MKTKNEPVEALETLVTSVRARRAAQGKPLPKSNWTAVAGTVKDDALFREAARLGEAWRKAENARR
ncbi:MAG: hypothetical protein ACKVY0_07775 [Prosthecobacter sp.]|uniref:hypothetical protein n=1 Tax=Prosthecobacter sp. TaxID=1965333 RepID=UPI003901C73A